MDAWDIFLHSEGKNDMISLEVNCISRGEETYMRKYCIFLFVLLLALGLSFAANAEEAEPTVYQSGDYKYILLADGTAQITEYTGIAAELIVPDVLDGYSVSSIGDRAFYECRSLTAITLPEGLTSIGDGAFSLCSSLTAITLPEGLTSIGDSAFTACHSLTAITLPDSITEMRANPFEYCKQLTNIQVSPDHPVFATIDGVLFNKTEKKLVCYPYGFTATEYQVPKGIRSIGDDAFYRCSSLTAITLPEGITSIGVGAFSWCRSLAAITLPESLESIGADAFADCSKNMQFTVVRDSYAAKWCKENGLNYTYPDSLDWLND